MKVSILIPTYHNPSKLARCLASLAGQSHLPDEVIVVHEKDDEVSENVLHEGAANLNITAIALNSMERMSRAVNAGISKATGDIVAFLDEDTMPEEEWVAKLIREFGDERIAACGGRDIIVVDGRKTCDHTVDDVGIIKWKGYIVGNQHRGRSRKNVAFLKGCNMAIRRVLINRLDENLLGIVRWEQDIFFGIHQNKGQILYDPSITVIHHKNDSRFLSSRFTFWFGHNTVYLFMKYLQGRERMQAIAFSFLFGDVSSPGLFRFIRWILTRNDQAFCTFCTSILGKTKGMITFMRTPGPLRRKI